MAELIARLSCNVCLSAYEFIFFPRDTSAPSSVCQKYHHVRIPLETSVIVCSPSLLCKTSSKGLQSFHYFVIRQLEKNRTLSQPTTMTVKDVETGKVKGEATAHPIDSSESGSEKGRTVASDSSEPLFQFMAGIKKDLAARLPLYADDWSRPKSIVTVVNATLYAFVIQLIPALIFAELMNRETEGNLATAEVLLSSSIMGIIYAIFAGQPLTIMGITGPVALLLGTSYGTFFFFLQHYHESFDFSTLQKPFVMCMYECLNILFIFFCQV